MNDFLQEDLTQSKPVIELLTVANEYCLFFEDAEKFELNDILIYFQRMAPLLYLKGSLLPAVETIDDAFAERFVTEEQWEDIFKTLRKKFVADDRYFIHDHNYDTIEASLADNLADIYQDMKDFVMSFQKGHIVSRQNGLAQVISLFSDHWGPIIINALAAVHRIMHKPEIDPALFEEDEWL
jgi:hypothetical protein